MCRDLAHGGARCARSDPPPADKAQRRAEAVAEQARATFSAEANAALDRLFASITEAATPAERTAAVRSWLDALAGVWHAVIRAIERAHERRIEAADARWRDQVGELLAQVREARRADELAALDRLHAAERVLAEEELLSRVNWSDELWRPCQEADLMDLQLELDDERLRLRKLEARQSRRPDPRVASEIRRGAARVECWRITLEGQRARLAATPHTRAEAQQRCADAENDVEAARAALRVMSGAPRRERPTGDEHTYLAHPELTEAVEHSRQHPEQRRARSVRA